MSTDQWTPLAGKTALVTGGASGIGLAIARSYAEAGARGVVLDLHAPAADVLPAGWTSLEVDVRDDASVASAMAGRRLARPHRRARAGCGDRAALARAHRRSTPSSGRTSCASTSPASPRALAHAIASLRDGAAVVAVASLNSWRGDANIPAYAASKHAVLGIVRSAALELGRRGIRVNAIAPGPIATEALLERMETRSPTSAGSRSRRRWQRPRRRPRSAAWPRSRRSRGSRSSSRPTSRPA